MNTWVLTGKSESQAQVQLKYPLENYCFVSALGVVTQTLLQACLGSSV